MQASNDTRTALYQERLARERRRRLAKLTLMDFVPRVSPDLTAPRHLETLVDLFERASDQGDVRAWSSVPPQHGKSVTLFHLLIRALLRDPTKRHGYGTYSVEFAREQQEKAKKIAANALLPLDRQTMEQWVTPEGGGIVWTGVGGQLTGRPIDGVFIADDLLKGRGEAESPAHRRAALDFLTSTVLTRLHPGSSLILNATRWHREDPTGVMKRTRNWPGINLPAINDKGKPLWPEARPVEFLELQRTDVGEYDWWSLYMGEPRPRGGRVFNAEPSWYETLPSGTFRQAVGLDFAYTTKSHADWSVAIEGRIYEDQIYITRMIRVQAEAPQFGSAISALGTKHILARISGTEKGIIQFLRKDLNLKVETIPASTDKFAFSQPVAAAWNAGKVHLPSGQPWTQELVNEVQAFTGISDAQDDIVDALGALHHALVITPRANLEQLRARSGL